MEVENATNDTPQSDVGNKTDYREMSDAQLDQALADTQNRDGAFEVTSGGSAYSSDTKSETIINPPAPTPLLDGLQPSPVEKAVTVEDFGTPLESYEVDNLNYSLAETEIGTDVLVALHKNQGVLTPEIEDMAKAVGVSERQIAGYKSHIANTANKAFVDAGMTFAEGRSLMQRVQKEFSPAEMEIFTKETNENPTKSLQTLKRYFDERTT